MRESRPRGSVRGALSNERPYREMPYCLTSQCSRTADRCLIVIASVRGRGRPGFPLCFPIRASKEDESEIWSEGRLSSSSSEHQALSGRTPNRQLPIRAPRKFALARLDQMVAPIAGSLQLDAVFVRPRD